MPEMKAANFKDAAAKDGSAAKERSKDNPKYFRGDELPVATTQATLTPAK
jgi:hypothetical protein